MKRIRAFGAFIVTLALLAPVFLPALAMAAKNADNVVIVADTRKLSGVLYWWAEMYNESHLLFAIMTMLIIPFLGCLADIVMSHIGIDLKHRDLAEK